MEIDQRLSQDMDDIGYEGGIPPDYFEQTYSMRDLEQLDKFMHIHGAIDQVEEHLDQNIGWFNKGADGEKLKKENLIFMMDSRLNWYLHIIAYNMYREFAGSEKMKELADGYLNERKTGKQMSEDFEKQELRNLWGTP
jgi:hypothetical protein